eukprot:6901440-Prymnesium_polylepis.2
MAPDAIGLFGISPLVLPKYDDLPAAYAARVHWTGYLTISSELQLSSQRSGDASFGGADGEPDAISSFLAASDTPP